MSSSSSPTSEVAHHGASDHCLNCATPLAPEAKFCHACGQDTANHPPSLFEFVHEFVAHYVALEGTLWRSLKGLAFRPGFLTVEYLAGRKARYVLPLRLLLTLGFVFFLLVKLVPSSPEDESSSAEIESVLREEAVVSGPSAASTPAAATFKLGGGSVVVGGTSLSQTKSQDDVATTKFGVELDDAPAWLRPQLEAANQRWEKDSSAEFERLKAKVRGMMPYAVLCSLPFFAGILSLVFWWRRYSYGAHFVFAMHLHAFFYLGLLLLMIPVSAVAWVVAPWIVVYPLLAIKRVYARNWLSAFGSSALVFVLHATLQVLMFATVFAIGALAP
ncbi:DUF3667 domain-containing protein [Ideonella sp.]|jgi:hypothetical protein|uniref:DUF3667 domain-containing protein n=1 Tax=Ideonella sp. TaxID=1929293 RepID=UPI0037C0030A